MAQSKVGTTDPSTENGGGVFSITVGSAENEDRGMVVTVQKQTDSDLLDFTEISIRQAFIRKVYIGFAVNIILGGVIVVICLNVPQIGNYFQENLSAFLGLLFATMVIGSIVDFSKTLRRKSPYNYIVTVIIVICFGFLIGGGVGEIRQSVYAAIVVGFLGIFLTLVAYWNKLDITGKSVQIGKFSAVLILVLLGLILVVSSPITLLILVISFLLVQTLRFFLYTQLTLGRGKSKFSPEEYVYATLLLCIYLGNMFIFTRLIFLFYFKFYN